MARRLRRRQSLPRKKPHWSRRNCSRRPHRPNARAGSARCGGRSAAPCDHLVRPAHRQAVRANHPTHRRRTPDRTHRKSGAHQFHAAENMVGAAARAGNLVARSHHLAAEGLFSLSPHRCASNGRRRSVRHAFLRCLATPVVEAHARCLRHQRKHASKAARIARDQRSYFQRRRRGDGFARRNAGRRRSRGSGRGRRGHGNRAVRSSQRDDWHFRRRVCRNQPPGARSARPHPHFLPRDSGAMARDGRHPGSRTFAALVSRRIRRGQRSRRHALSSKTLTSALPPKPPRLRRAPTACSGRLT